MLSWSSVRPPALDDASAGGVGAPKASVGSCAVDPDPDDPDDPLPELDDPDVPEPGVPVLDGLGDGVPGMVTLTDTGEGLGTGSAYPGAASAPLRVRVPHAPRTSATAAQ
jgi:hypothetical protein